MFCKITLSSFFLFFFITSILSQQNQLLIKNHAPTVFIDCQHCDQNYIKEEVPIVNYVNDRKDADVHILFSRQITGSNGHEYSLFFIGYNSFAGIDDTVVFATQEFDSDDAVREKTVKAIKIGLVEYLAKTDVVDYMVISYDMPKKETVEKAEDPYNFWVYRARMRSYLNGQKSTDYKYLYGSLSASRVTEELKLYLAASVSYNEDVYDYDDYYSKSISRSHYFNLHTIFSIDDHWSWGFWGRASSSTYNNIKNSFSISPGIEYNFFRYSESNRRQLRIECLTKPIHNNYIEETLYDKTSEFLVQQELAITLGLIQPWGSISTSIEGSVYYHDINLNNVQLYGEISLKLLKGLSFDLYGYYDLIHDQIALPKGGATIEEVLLQRKELETQYSYFISIGFSYSFGSIYNNIVNPRFGD